jgi:hypothetical protein
MVLNLHPHQAQPPTIMAQPCWQRTATGTELLLNLDVILHADILAQACAMQWAHPRIYMGVHVQILCT